MAAFTPKRPLVSLPFLLPSISDATALTFSRNQSSYRRTVKKLRVKPAPSFAPTPGKVVDHIIFNPPSSAPSVYHTPTKFLPKDDIRRQLASPRANTSSAAAGQDLPPPVSQPYTKKYHLTTEDINEIRRLRKEDPYRWSQDRLAEKFECSSFFIARVAPVPEEKKLQQQQVLAAVQSRWGPKRREARDDRTIRREAWGRA